MVHEFNIIVSSSDVAAYPPNSPASFTCPIPALSLPGQWEARLVNASFAKSSPGNSVFLYGVNWLENSHLGSTLGSWFYRTRPVLAGDLPTVYIENSSESPPWFKISTAILQDLSIEIQESDGTPIPNTQPAVLQLMLRRIE